MDGVELAVRFSYITNSLGFCGPNEADKQFLQYAKKKKNEEEVKKSLLRFEALQPYLSAIAKKSDLDIFDYKVIEAYWIGNELLDNFSDEDMKLIIKKLMQRGLPKSIGEKLIKNLPKGLVPHHNFNVFYVGVGQTTKAVETTLQNMDNCRVSWGKIVEMSQDSLLVKTQKLKKNPKEGFFSLEDDIKTVVYLKEFLPEVKKGDNVALHWGFACLKLNEERIGNLRKYGLVY